MTNAGRIVITLVLFLCTGASWGQINVTPGQAGAALASKLAGQGVTILNTTFNCPAWASGTFKVVSSNLGLDSGIVLTNGRAASLPGIAGVNGSAGLLASTNNGTPGDPALTQLAGQHTLDACSLEFDVIPQGDTIRFNYVFSSEEYISAVCGPYNDVFGFFISGPGIAVQENMALVPGTNIPVTINSINNGVPGSTGNIANCTSMGPGSPFTGYYKDNSGGTTLTHQGLTAVLQAVHHVNRCGIYHLKLAIADAGNGIYDSGVFLKAGSLESENFNVTAVRPSLKDTTAFCIKGCLPGKFIVKRSKADGQPQTIKYVVGGSAVSGYDYSALPDSIVIPAHSPSAEVVVNGLPTPPSGPRTIQIFILTPGTCFGLNNIIDSAMLVIYDTLHLSSTNAENTICVGDAVQLGIEADSFLSYQWTPAEGLDNPLRQQPMASPTHDIQYTVVASLPGTVCPPKTATVNVKTRLTPHLQLPSSIEACAYTSLQLEAVTTDSNLFYSYQWTGPDNFSSNILSPVIERVGERNAGTYSITVTNDTNRCKNTALVTLQVNTPAPPAVDGPIIYCPGDALKDLPLRGTNLRWYTSPEDTAARLIPDYSTDRIGSYHFFVAEATNGCESARTPVDVEIKKCCDGKIFLPNAFSPNNDGENDKFRPLMDYGYYITSMRVVNRWGQLVYTGFDSWDGTFNGIPAEAGTYFYRITFGCIRGGTEERQGDIMLLK